MLCDIVTLALCVVHTPFAKPTQGCTTILSAQKPHRRMAPRAYTIKLTMQDLDCNRHTTQQTALATMLASLCKAATAAEVAHVAWATA